MCGPPATVNGQEADSLALATRRGSRGPVIWSFEEVRDEPFRVAGPFQPAHLVHRASAPRWRGTAQMARLSLPRPAHRDLLTVTCLYGG